MTVTLLLSLTLSSLLLAYFTLQVMIRLAVIVSGKVTKIDFPSWLVQDGLSLCRQ
ncbi:hypothetical protein ACLHFD_001988 [Vibrio alginolyticus]